VFTELFVDMGDEQSIEDDLSSFSSHLGNLKAILENASPASLVLIDEIGSGTDPSEGAAIAAGALNELAALCCLTIVTTHHGALKTVALESDRFQNAAMEFDLETLRPTYRYRAGIPGSSYAIEMAERMHLPETVLTYARELKGSASNKLEDLLIELEKK